MKRAIIAYAISALALGGCVSTYIVPTDKDTYNISRNAPAFYWGRPNATEAEVYSEANKICDKDNKKVKTIKLDVVNQFPGRSGSVTLQFKCDEPIDTSTATPTLTPTEAGTVKDKPSIADKLKELDSLHKQGLITDGEYANKKQEILRAM